MPLLAPAPIRAQLREAASAFERATRSRIQAEHHHARALRSAIRAMLREPTPGDGTALAMFLDAAILVTIAATRWHQLRHHDQQVTAAQQTLLHLQAAYDQAAAPLTALVRHRPPQPTVDRHVHHIRRAVPAHSEQVLADPAIAALTAALAEAEALGHDPERLLRQAADQRALDDARSPARTLAWRIQRVSARPTPNARARAAQAHSAARPDGTPSTPAHEATTVSLPQPRAHRR